jgi:hypothetical protein
MAPKDNDVIAAMKFMERTVESGWTPGPLDGWHPWIVWPLCRQSREEHAPLPCRVHTCGGATQGDRHAHATLCLVPWVHLWLIH